MADELRPDAAEALSRMKTKLQRPARRAIEVLVEDLAWIHRESAGLKG